MEQDEQHNEDRDSADLEEASNNEEQAGNNEEQRAEGIQEDNNRENSAQEEDEGVYDVQRMQQMYDLTQQMASDNIAGPPITTLANHWGTQDDECAVQAQHQSVVDILLDGSSGGGSLEQSAYVDFIVPNQEAAEYVRAFVENSSFEGNPPKINVHKGALLVDRFMDKSDFSIQDNIDTSSLEARWSEINRVSHREEIEEDWASSNEPEERRRQYRLCYNYLLYMCMFTCSEVDETNSMDSHVNEDDEETQHSGTQDTQRRYPLRDRKNRNM